MSASARATPPGYLVTPIADLSLPETRERLSSSAIEGFFAIADRWHLSIDQAGALLGDLPRSSAYKLRYTPKTLGRDQLTRITYVVGIFNALHVLLPDALADAWMTVPKDNHLFRGQSPLDFVIRTGIPGLHDVRSMLEALGSGQ
jgi:uncharacterized protein (DUF2384 family)